MSARRFAVVMTLFVAGGLLLWMYVRTERAKRPAAEDPRQTATQPAPTATAPAAAQTLPASAPAPQTPGPATQSASAATAATAATATASTTTAAKSPEREEWLFRTPPETTKCVIGSLAPSGGYRFQVELSTEGAAVNGLKLAGYFMTVDDKRLFDKDPQAYEKARQEDPEKYRGHYSLLNPVGSGESQVLPMATREIRVYWPDREQPAHIRLDNKQWSLESATPTTLPDGGQEVRFTFTLLQDVNAADPAKPVDAREVLRVVKTYEVRKDSFSFHATLKVENLSSVPLRVELDQAGPMGLPREGLRDDSRRAAYGELKDEKIQPRTKDRKELEKIALRSPSFVGGSDNAAAPVVWLGETSQYFGSILYLQPAAGTKGPAAGSHKAGFYVSAAMESPSSRTWVTGVKFQGLELAAGESREASFDVFAGPKLRNLFYDVPLYKQLDYISLIDLGACWFAPSWLTLILMWLLQKLSWVALGNYGVAIFLLVLVVRVILHPLTKKGQVSMSKMQKLAPQMQKLKEKYADDKNALNKEMMQLYKHAGATPILGCLPMLLQMPIWVALYSALNATVELRHAAFLPVWITDLAAPDAIFKWKQSYWIIGNSFNLLPILLAVAMYFQTKMNPQMGQAGPQQASQQKMMKILMPGMMLVFFYNMPSGLSLYVMASTFAGVAEQYVIRKHIEERGAREAAKETAVDLPGKRSRTSRPKKPKGPFWVKGK